jgi:hypothetical protein
MSNKTAAGLAMLYLFYSADQKITSEDLTWFKKYGRSVNGFKDAKDTIVAECEKILSGEQSSSTGQEKTPKSRFDCVADTFNAFLGSSQGFFSSSPDREIKHQVLWWFSEILYRYQGVSKNRKTLLNLWVEKGGIDPAVADEMRDTAKTICDLEAYKEWLSKQDQSELGAFTAEVDASLKDTIKSVTELISVA